MRSSYCGALAIILCVAASGCVRYSYDLADDIRAPLPQHVPPPAPPVRQTLPKAVPYPRARVLVEELQPFPPRDNTCAELSEQLAHAYRHFRYDDVLELAAHVVSHPRATDAQRVHAYVFAAAASYLQREYERARACIRKAAAVSPDVHLSEKAFPAAMRTFLIAEMEQARRQ